MSHHVSYEDIRAALTEWQKVKQISKMKCTTTFKDLWGGRDTDFVLLHINSLQKEFQYLTGGYGGI